MFFTISNFQLGKKNPITVTSSIGSNTVLIRNETFCSINVQFAEKERKFCHRSKSAMSHTRVHCNNLSICNKKLCCTVHINFQFAKKERKFCREQNFLLAINQRCHLHATQSIAFRLTGNWFIHFDLIVRY